MFIVGLCHLDETLYSIKGVFYLRSTGQNTYGQIEATGTCMLLLLLLLLEATSECVGAVRL